jgi:hypothetical protein
LNVWTCKPCADRLGLSWGGQASHSGGWCVAGAHPVPAGKRIEYVADAMPTPAVEAVLQAEKRVAIVRPVDGNGQGLLL